MFEIPKELPTDAKALADLRAEAVDAFNDLYKDGSTSAEDLERMEEIVNFVGEIDERNAADKRAASAAELKSKLDARNDDKGDTEPEETNDDQAADDETGEDTEPEQEREDGDRPETEPEQEPEREQVTAAARRTTTFSRAASGKTPQNVPAQQHGFRLTTSAKNFETGVVDSRRVAEEFGALAEGRAARVIGANGRSETTVAYLERDFGDEFTIRDDADAERVLEHATNESRLDGGSLTAAGGWCAPSETVYDFLPTAAPAGLLSLPEVTIRRGGVRVPKEPDFASIYNDLGFFQTEAEAQAGTEKNCYEIPCGEFAEFRLNAAGICLTAGILQSKAWPELTTKFVNEALRIHQHKLNAYKVRSIIDGSTKVGTLTGPMFGTAGAVLSALELQVSDLRAKHRIGRTQSVEGIAPEWLLSVLRADLAYRERVLPEVVTDDQIRAHFRNLGAEIQFIADWQNDQLGGATPATAWPDTVQVILYPAGTWWSATEPVINLGIVHDSALLKQNRQIQLFTEDGVAVGKRGPESRLVEIPISVDGTVGARHNAGSES